MKSKKLKKVLAAVLAGAMLTAIPFPVHAEEEDLGTLSGDIYYDYWYYMDGYRVNGFSDTAVDVVIPEEIDGHTITYLVCFCNDYFLSDYREWTSAYPNIKTISIPATVEWISDGSLVGGGWSYESTFADYPNLEAFNVSEGNENYCSIDGVLYRKEDGVPVELMGYPPAKKDKVLNLPDTVTEISQFSLQFNPYLEEVVISDKNPAFHTYDGVVYQDETDGNYDEDTGEYVYTKTGNWLYVICPGGKTSVTIPEQVKSLSTNLFMEQDSDFSYCSQLKEVHIPETLTNVDCGCFLDTPARTVKTVNNADFIYVDNWLLECNNLEETTSEILEIPEGTIGVASMAFGCFVENSNAPRRYPWSYWNSGIECPITEISLPGSLKYVGTWAFSEVSAGIREIPETMVSLDASILSLIFSPSLIVPASVEAVTSQCWDAFDCITILNADADYVEKLIATTYAEDEDGNIDWEHEVLANPDMILYGYSGSTAEACAEENGLTFVPLDSTDYMLGDVNHDGTVNVSDLVLLRRWLLADEGAKIAWRMAADLNQDGTLDVFDLALLKRQLTAN